MINQINQGWWYKVNGASRMALASGAAKWGWFPLLNEYPKCGGSWMAQMLADALQIRFPRNRLPHIGSCLLHGHYRARSVGTDVVMVHRDGRDVMVSLYHHRIIGNQFTDQPMQDALRRTLKIDNAEDVAANMPRFIEAVAAGQVHPFISWSDFAEQWIDNKNVRAVTSYEAMKENAATALQSVVSDLGRTIDDNRAKEIAAKYDFKAQTDRTPGDENSTNYLRKGIVGDWQEKFTLDSRQIFDHHMGKMLIALGYEENSDWVDKTA